MVSGITKVAYLCLVASVLSGCVAQPQFSVDGRPYYGHDPDVQKMIRMGNEGLVPISVSCKMPRSGPTAKLPDGIQTTIRWTKATNPYPGWTVVIGDSAGAKAERAAAIAKGYHKVSSGSFYQSVARKQMTCELWRAQ